MAGNSEDKSNTPPSEEPGYDTTDFSMTTDLSQASPADPSDITLKSDTAATLYAEDRPTLDGPIGFASADNLNTLPTDIPGFVVEKELGRGAFGVVYAALDSMLDRKVAIKKPIIAQPVHRQQYIDEARKAAKLDHPGIVPIYYVGLTSGGEPFVVQKLIEGTSLRGLLKSLEGRLPIDQVVSLMRQVCAAVDAAHTAGIVHRDLKPENLLIEPNGKAYVADFGLAILDEDEQDSKVREIAGTPFYMSPEQFSGRNDWLDGRSDIWALGVIFYELLSGKTPFFGKKLSELKDEIRNKDPRPLHQRDPGIPAEFDAFFRKCCAKQVSERFAGVREMIDELDRICDSLDLVPFDWNAPVGSRAFGVPSMRGSFLDRSRDSMLMSGGRTQRSMESTVRRSHRDSLQTAPSGAGRYVGWTFQVSALMAVLAGMAWLTKIGPFREDRITLQPVQVADIPAASLPTASDEKSTMAAATSNSIEPTKPTLPVKPVKPFVVSMKGDGTHDSIEKAIADSDEGDTLTIFAGTYRESLVIDKSLTLIGKNTVRILSADKPCLEVRGESEVSIENMDFDCQADEKNTIEIFGGRLNLKDCDVFAGSAHGYDCVKARSNTTFVADRCSFQSTEHAAVYGDKDSTLGLRECKIGFPGNSDFGLKRCGIQALGAKGLIRNCVVTGPCVAAVDWLDSPSQTLTIEASRFENCEIGVQVRDCGSVNIRGLVDQACEVINARFGINIVNSRADIHRLDVEGTDEASKVGLQITKGSTVHCADSRFVGMRCGVIAHRSRVTIEKIETDDTSFAGILVDESNLEADSLRIANIQNFGLAVLSTNAQVDVKSIYVDARLSNGQKLASAVYATSGELSFGEADFRNCLCGVCVDPDREIIEFVGYPKKTLADLLKTSKKSDHPLPKVTGDKMGLEYCEYAWTFAGIGTGKVGEITGELPEARKLPRLLYPDKLRIEGDGRSDFSIRLKDEKK